MEESTTSKSNEGANEDWHEDISAVRALCCDFMRTFLPPEISDERKSVKLCYTLMEPLIQCMNYCIEEGDTIIQMHLLSLLRVVLTNGGRDNVILTKIVEDLRSEFLLVPDVQVEESVRKSSNDSSLRRSITVSVLSASASQPENATQLKRTATTATLDGADQKTRTP